ncbi:MAG: hypothetical protein ACTSU5_15790 [Promethearchaeota archaeon]
MVSEPEFWSRLESRVRESAPFFLTLALTSMFVVSIYAVVTFRPELLESVEAWLSNSPFPVRVDALVFGGAAVVLGLAGYRNGRGTDPPKPGFWACAYIVAALQAGVFIWDNAWIALHLQVMSPAEQVSYLSTPMEVQFIHVTWLTVGTYRFYVLVDLAMGLVTILWVRTWRAMVLSILAAVYIYSSLAIGILAGLPISPPAMTPAASAAYLLGNLVIGLVFAAAYLVVRRRELARE